MLPIEIVNKGDMMPMFSIIAFSSLVIAMISTYFASKGSSRLYWVSALAIYIFSFLAGFSIGQITVGFTFIPLALAIGYSFRWIKNKTDSMYFICLGVLIGFLMVSFVGNFLFYPLFSLLH